VELRLFGKLHDQASCREVAPPIGPSLEADGIAGIVLRAQGFFDDIDCDPLGGIVYAFFKRHEPYLGVVRMSLLALRRPPFERFLKDALVVIDQRMIGVTNPGCTLYRLVAADLVRRPLEVENPLRPADDVVLTGGMLDLSDEFYGFFQRPALQDSPVDKRHRKAVAPMVELEQGIHDFPDAAIIHSAERNHAGIDENKGLER